MEHFSMGLRNRFKAAYKGKDRSNKSSKTKKPPQNIGRKRSSTRDLSSTSSASSASGESSGSSLTPNREENEDSVEMNEAPIYHEEDMSDLYHSGDEEIGPQYPQQVSESQVEPLGTMNEGQTSDMGQDAVQYSAEELQALRDKAYIAFEGEEESDYTKGPVRIVDASDGVESCGALLLNLELSAKLQKAIQGLRAFEKQERIRLKKERELVNLSFAISGQKSSLRCRLFDLKKKDPVDLEEKAALENEMSVLERMDKEYSEESQRLKMNLEFHGRRVRKLQSEALAIISEAFVAAQLLQQVDDTPDTPVEPMILEQEYAAFCERLRQQDDDDMPIPTAPMHADGDYFIRPQRPMTTEEEQTQRLREYFWSSRERLQDAQAAFDRREVDRTRELQATYDAVARGETPFDESPEDFDIRWVKRIQELTRELVEAEAAYAEAKKTAAECGMDIPMDDQTSDFVQGGDNGYRLSFEQTMMGTVESPTIRTWADAIPDLASPSFNDRVEEADEWEAEDVEISDSVSLVAEGADRRRIEKWRQICGL
jgi:hypothetical protein